MQYLQSETDLHFFENSTPPFFSQRGFIRTPLVRPGYFWYVPFVQVKDSDGNAQQLAIILISPEELGKFVQDLPNAILTMSAIPGTILVAPMNGFQGGQPWLGSATFSSTVDGGTGTIGSPCAPLWKDGAFVIPSGWCLAAVEINNIPSGITHAMTLTVLYRELRNECLDFMWD